MQKDRLDVLLTERGLAESRSLAQKLVMAGQVRVDGQVVFKPATKFPPEVDDSRSTRGRALFRGVGKSWKRRWWPLGWTDLGGKVCVDVGASTGGFTDCLLQHGAGKGVCGGCGLRRAALEAAQRSAGGGDGADQRPLRGRLSRAGCPGHDRCFIYIPAHPAAGGAQLVGRDAGGRGRRADQAAV